MIKIGDLVDERYRITSRIATGGMADIYEANDLIARQIVCLKVMKSELLNDQKNVQRFERETEAAASLCNPNIVRVFGRGVFQGRPYMTTEYVRGLTLREKLEKQGMLGVSEACDIMLQLAKGVSYIHKHGIVHRDLKPENIFYISDGTVKISDFGISSLINEVSNDEFVQGTVHYCAPEILMGKSFKETCDIYSMGIVFYELLTGTVPFDGDTANEVAMKHIKKHLKDPSKVVTSIPKVFDRIIAKCCKKREDERYQSSEEFSRALTEAIANKNNLKPRKSFFSKLFGLK